MTQSLSVLQSSWRNGEFTRKFRFMEPAVVFSVICSAMAERSLAINHFESSLDTYGGRIDVKAENAGPLSSNRLETRHRWNLGSYDAKENMWHFLKNRIWEIASCYCDPEKAHDFDLYPELDNWTPESLEEKLKGDYVKFSSFCDKEKYLIFIYKVLNLCTVRRTFTANCSNSGYYRDVGGLGDGYYYYSNVNAALNVLKQRPFVRSSFYGQMFNAECDDGLLYTLRQYGTRFITWVDDKRPCDIKFYGCASDEGIDDFSPLGISGVKKDKWFCAGSPEVFETLGNIKTAALELPFADSYIPEVHELEPSTDKTTGFTLKKLQMGSVTDCYGIAVRDQRNYLKYWYTTAT